VNLLIFVEYYLKFNTKGIVEKNVQLRTKKKRPI